MLGTIRNPAGERLDYSFAAGAEASRDLVVIGHGVTANKDRAWAVTLADTLASAGLASLRFSFAGNGDSDGEFRAATVTKEVSDLGAVLDAAAGWRIAYVGHSMGAAVGVLRASRDARIHRLVSLGGMARVADFAMRKFGHLEPDRDVMWDEPECPLSRAFMDDMRAIGSVEDRAREITVPWLLVHGTDDAVVPPDDSRRLHDLAGGRAQLVELPGVDHVFSGDGAELMARHVRDWLVREPAG